MIFFNVFPYYDYPYYNNYYQPYSGPQLTMADIVNMTAQGDPDTQIINAIISTGSTFSLTTGDINYLRENRVSDRVIDFMLQSQNGSDY